MDETLVMVVITFVCMFAIGAAVIYCAAGGSK